MRLPLHRLITGWAILLTSPLAAIAADVCKECPEARCAIQEQCPKVEREVTACPRACTVAKDSNSPSSLLAPCAMQKALSSFCATCEHDDDLAISAKSCGVVKTTGTASCASADSVRDVADVMTVTMPLASLCGQMVKNLFLAGTVWLMHSPNEVEVEFAWNEEADLRESEMIALENVDVYMIRRGNVITLDVGAPGGYVLNGTIDQHLAEAMQALATAPLGAEDVVEVVLEDGEVATVARLQVVNIPNAALPAPATLEINQEHCEACPTLAAMQELYGDLCEQGCDKEAEELIDEILAQKSLETARRQVRDAVHYEWKGANSGPKHHQVGYQPGVPPERYPLASENSLGQARYDAGDWELAAVGKVSFHFQGASLLEVADFFRHATGREVVVDTPNHGSYYAPAGIHVLCRDKTVEQSLRVVLGSCGLGYAVVDEALVIGEPVQIEALRPQSQDCWTP